MPWCARESGWRSPRPDSRWWAKPPTATDGFSEAVRLAPDVVLMDISLPGDSGLVVAARLRQELPSTRVLMLSVYHQAEYVLEAVRIGAHGYLLKDTLPADLREAIRTVAGGGTHFARALSSSGAAEAPPLSAGHDGIAGSAHRARTPGADRHRRRPHQQGNRGHAWA